MAQNSQSTIPAGYKFLNLETFISNKAYEMLEDLMKKSANRNPEVFDMYIYNDFYSYAVLDLVDKQLSVAHSKITKKDYDEAYCILEALTVFNDMESAWLMCDDGERVKVTNKVYGAMVITLLRALDKGGRLDVTHFPSLEFFLKHVVEWCEGMKEMSGSPNHDLVCKAIGRRLFKDKPEEYIALEKARLEEWMKGLKAEAQAEVREDIKEMEGKDKSKPWYAGGKSSDEQDKDRDFVLSRVWKQYREYLATVPKTPMRGPRSWDISKWTAAQKKEFEFAGMSDEEFDD